MFTFRSQIPVPVETAFHWHQRPGAIERLLPPWQNVQIEQHANSLEPGARVVLKMNMAGVPVRWVAEHTALEPNIMFQDRQVSGPFARWLHTHHFARVDEHHCVLEDEVEYEVPGGFLGRKVGNGSIELMLLQMFRYRHEITTSDLIAHDRYKERSAMRIAITGASGLIGSQLRPFLTTGGHEVQNISRRPGGKDTIQWDIHKREIDTAALEGVDAVIHLAGENIASRWTLEKKREIRESRVEGTAFLSEQLAKLQNPPKVLVCASAMGYYGDRGDEILTESSPPGRGFLAAVCRDWEAAADPARAAGIRVVHARIGLVLSPQGGALKTMLLPFRLGVGGPIGSGRQYWSWISLDDTIGALHHILMNEQISGPVNMGAPWPVTNREFTILLGKVLNRPTLLTVPKFAARTALGEMADEMLLSSMRMEPQVLEQEGYNFRDPDLERCLRKLLGRQ